MATSWGKTKEAPAATAEEAISRLNALHAETLDHRLELNNRLRAAEAAATKAWDDQNMAAARSAQHVLDGVLVERHNYEREVMQRARDIVRIPNPGKLKVFPHPQLDGDTIETSFPEADVLAIRQGVEAIEQLVDPAFFPPNVRVGQSTTNRAFAMPEDLSIYINSTGDPSSVAHELGHVIESANQKILQAAVNFRDQRGAAPTRLMVLRPDRNYRDDESALPDKFFDPYVGKTYPDSGPISVPTKWSWGNGKTSSTEVVSMGLQLMFSDPMWFSKVDPEHFSLIFNAVRRP